MIDAGVLMRQWLLRCAPLLEKLPDRENTKSIYAGDLPQGTDPKEGPSVTIEVRGGDAHSEIPIIQPSVKIRVWCGVNERVRAQQVYGIIHDYIHGANNINLGEFGVVMSCLCSVLGYDVTDPETSWATVVSFYELQARSS